MPRNRFPDSPEKRELRRRDLRKIRELAGVVGDSLDYCGLPSVEFLDVVCWHEVIRSVTGFEKDPDTRTDMDIERDKLQFPFPVQINPKDYDNILAYLAAETYKYGLYNIDLYSGAVYSSKDGENKSTVALRQLFSQQAKNRQSFVLICTFNVRDTGAAEYDQFIAGVQSALADRAQSEENIQAHTTSQAAKLKLCFPYYCWQQAHSCSLEQLFSEVTVYQSSNTMVHIMQAFRYVGGALAPIAPVSKVIELTNAPLFEIRGQVRRKQCQFPQVL
jgi:hypothetical protein